MAETPDINPTHLKIVTDILHKILPQDVTVWVFGSRAKWTAKEFSDLDLALESKDGGKIPADIIARLDDDFEESDLPWKVDVVDINAVAPSFKEIIMRDRVRLEGLENRSNQTLDCLGMSSGLQTLPLKEIATFKYGKTIIKKNIFPSGDFPVFSGYQIVGYLPDYMFEHPQLIIVCRGAGGTGDVKISPPKCSISNLAIIINCDERKIDKGYLFWVLVHSDTYSLRTGSAQPQITINSLNSFDVDILPDLCIQKEISDVLFNLNKKIELNQRMNKTLEEMTQAIFKCWFVDFEPTRAKIAQKEGSGESDADICTRLKITPEILSLFPATLTDSELGPIPEGWEKTNLSKIAELNSLSWSKKNAPDQVVYVDLANTKWGVINSTETFYFEEAPSRARRVLMVNDTIIGTVRPANGSYALIKSKGYTGSTGFAVLSPKSSKYTEFLYLASTSEENIGRLGHLADGGAYPAVRPDVVLGAEITLPVVENELDKVLSVFSSITVDLFNRREMSFKQNETLSQTRDTLLPKLLSGEISVGETPNIVECI